MLVPLPAEHAERIGERNAKADEHAHAARPDAMTPIMRRDWPLGLAQLVSPRKNCAPY